MNKLKFYFLCLSLLGSYPFQVLALNQASDYDFAAATNWTAQTAVTYAVCNTNSTSTVANAHDTSARLSTFNNGVWQFAETNDGNNRIEAGNITQTFTVPGSGSQKVNIRFTFNATGTPQFSGSWNGTAASNWVRADVETSAGVFAAAGPCQSWATSDVATTTIGSFGTYITLTGGSAYRLRISNNLRNAVADDNLNVYVDTVIVSTPPVGVTPSAPAATSNAQVDWTTSTATSTALAIHSTTPYNIYRGTSSGGETLLSSVSTNTYTDSTTAGNTTYYYWVTNLDTSSVESASSTEVSQLTRPAAPGTPTFSSVTTSSMTVSWTAPTAGASTYDVSRCTGTGCSSYAVVSNDQAGLTFADSGLSSGTVYRYKITPTNATGDGVDSSAAEQQTDAATATAASGRTLRLFEGFKINFVSGKIILHQKP